jgi:Outer membrane protein beta-barrel domain
VRKFTAIVFVLFLAAAAAMAQVPSSGYAFFGYSLNHGDTGASTDGTLNGWEGSVEGRMIPHIYLVADVSQQFGSLYIPSLGANADERTSSFLFGPRASVRFGPVRPYVHFLIGAGHLHEINHFLAAEHSETAYAHAIGGGVDYRIAPRVNWRVQLDSLTTNYHDNWQHNARFSTGLSFRF